MKKNVLVFPCGSEIGLEINRSLKYSTHFSVVGASSVSDHGKFVYDNYIEGVPYVGEDNFIEEINKIAKKYSIDYIFPAHDSVVLRLAEAKEAGELNCEVVTSNLETCRISRSKQKTYNHLKSSIECPEVYSPDSVPNNTQVFMKPDVGQGSKGVYLANTKKEVEQYRAKDSSLLVLEYLPGKEYTIDCFTDMKGELLYSAARTRSRVSNGISTRSLSVEDERFKKIAEQINRKLIFRGVWFFQVKERSNKDLVLLEVSPRVAGTMGVSRVKGVNLVLLSLFDRGGVSVSIPKNLPVVMVDRALYNTYRHNIKYSHVYVDYDDTIIIKGSVNLQLIVFLYKAWQNKVKLHLITRHKGDIHESLKKHRLSDNLFDEIITLNEDQEKSNFILSDNSIFIDDSFSERSKVQEVNNILTFDTHSVEGLL